MGIYSSFVVFLWLCRLFTSFFAVIIACCFVNIIIKFVSYFRKVRDLSPSKRKAEMEKIQVANYKKKFKTVLMFRKSKVLYLLYNKAHKHKSPKKSFLLVTLFTSGGNLRAHLAAKVTGFGVREFFEFFLYNIKLIIQDTQFVISFVWQSKLLKVLFIPVPTGLTQKNLWQIFILQFKSFYKLKLQLKLNF